MSEGVKGSERGKGSCGGKRAQVHGGKLALHQVYGTAQSVAGLSPLKEVPLPVIGLERGGLAFLLSSWPFHGIIFW